MAIINICQQCKISFQKKHNPTRIYKFCSMECGYKHPISEETRHKQSISHMGKTSGKKGKKASPETIIKLRLSHITNGNTTINETIRHSVAYKEWAKTIKERDDFTCQICNIRGGILRSNHIKKFSDCPELRLDLTNGITICESCDLKFIFHNELNCEDYFNFNLIARGII